MDIVELISQKGQTIDNTNTDTSSINYKDVGKLVGRIGIYGENIAVETTGELQYEGIWEPPVLDNTAFNFG